MNSSPSEREAARDERPSRAVLCVKCERLNAWGANSCERCGARLYIACNDCGKKNERARTRCRECGRRLHKGCLERFSGQFSPKRLGITPGLVLLFVVAVLVALLGIKVISGAPLGF